MPDVIKTYVCFQTPRTKYIYSIYELPLCLFFLSVEYTIKYRPAFA